MREVVPVMKQQPRDGMTKVVVMHEIDEAYDHIVGQARLTLHRSEINT